MVALRHAVLLRIQLRVRIRDIVRFVEYQKLNARHGYVWTMTIKLVRFVGGYVHDAIRYSVGCMIQ